MNREPSLLLVGEEDCKESTIVICKNAGDYLHQGDLTHYCYKGIRKGRIQKLLREKWRD
jgi:hypothetical protein